MTSANLCQMGGLKIRDIVIGLLVVALVGGFIYFRQNQTTDQEEPETRVPETLSVEDEMEERFNMNIPEDVDRAELSDVAGGDARGLATRQFDDGRFTHSVLADLPDPEEGKFYEGWLVDGDNFMSTGRMRIAKGGYLLEFESSEDLTSYNRVVVTLEDTDDETPEEHVLEGEF